MKFLVAALLALVSAAPHADEVDVLLERARSLETKSTDLLVDHYRFEDELVSPESDRLLIFFSLPHGARVIMTELTIYLDGKQVLSYPYSVDELMLLQGRSSQLLYLNRIPPGPHTLKAVVKVMQGSVQPMQQPYKFTKGKKAKFIELQLAGYGAREFAVTEW
jgi:hypothetical protein